MQLLDCFDRICIINLPERRDRRRQVERELSRLGLRADGQRIRFVPGIRMTAASPFPSTGARGCYLSHLAVLRQALADGVGSVLVLEDDVSFAPALAQPQPDLSAALLAGGWDFAYPGHTAPCPADVPRWQITQRPLVCAHCYAVSRDALGPLVAYLEACLMRPPGDPAGGPMHVDGALSMFRAQAPERITLICAPSLVRQRGSRSDIAGSRWFDRGLLRPLSASLRALRELGRRAHA
ncbi:glycosyltransferase family 25 protein [Ralstonia solanacearum]|uniref:glycosyltransferase family 25 protein n=1 Tax=Ralstonia solanacearum TaxID=305 RepID=UPI0005C4F5E5|nr:glycosyltransferase family 25 protein [Ralstonia solanacearum]MDB0542240.1 glycosyltransferase family 25 protein [Ralstonia solanacearum]MDB0552488.1 glycosyltransferase family 25 protein [Ralstonia solanacearum]MDB0557204.1 glycosyltransferase family 25 protein [Ralstonia solanacearum]